MKNRMLAAVLLLAGCAQSDTLVDRIAKACADIAPLAKEASLIPGVPASIAAYAIAGCETAVGLAKLRLDPTSVAWLEELRAKLSALLGKA